MSSSTVFEQTPTTICCGIFSLRVGVRIVSLVTLFEGACQLHVYLSDFLSGEPVYRWGPRKYEKDLQMTSGIVGGLAIIFGLVGILSTRTCSASLIRIVRRFQSVLLLWTVLWFVLVGVPVEVQYIEVPAVERWPISKLPGMPMRPMVDPEWPDGKPTVCGDIADIKARLVKSLNKKQKNRFLRKTLRKVYTRLLRKVLTCQQTVRLFWGWGAFLVLVRFYCIHVLSFFLTVVLHGGDGVMIMGSLDDLNKPFSKTTSSLVMIQQQVRNAFEQMDTDGDGKLSLEELLQYLEGSNNRYKGISKGLPNGKKPQDDSPENCSLGSLEWAAQHHPR